MPALDRYKSLICMRGLDLGYFWACNTFYMAMQARPKIFLPIAAVVLIVVIGLILYQTNEKEEPHSRGDQSMSDLVKEASAEPVAEETPVVQMPVPETKLQNADAATGKSESLAADTIKSEESKSSANESDAATPFADSPEVRKQERIKIDPPIREIGQAWLDDEGRNDFSMPVTDGRDLQIQVERFESIGGQAGEFIGSVKGLPGSSVRLSYRGTAEAGTIRIPTENRTYRIFPGKDGAVIVQERDLNNEAAAKAMPPLNVELPPVPDFIPPPPPQEMIEKIPEVLD